MGDFRENLAKVLIKFGERRASVLFPGGQEAGEPLVSVWKCQNWPEKVSKDHREKQNTTCECAAAANIGAR